jgi:hypothetical protein
MKKLFLFLLLGAGVAATAQNATLKTVDSTTTFSRLTQPVVRGTLIKTANFHFYEINEKVNQIVPFGQPEVVVYQEGKKYRIKIQGIDKLLACNKIQEVIESNIEGVMEGDNVREFRGYDGTTSFKLSNLQVWKQDETTSNVFTDLLKPAVTIYLTGEGYKMKITGLNQDPILVKKVK